ncbi:basic proline-rich protein-like isoform X1 [Tachysurus ichikawai]
MEEDFIKKSQPDVITQQHMTNVDKSYSETKRADSGPNGCLRCCKSTKNCLMSPECGRAISIANVIAMCGMCIRMWTCKFKHLKLLFEMFHMITMSVVDSNIKCYKFTISSN